MCVVVGVRCGETEREFGGRVWRESLEGGSEVVCRLLVILSESLTLTLTLSLTLSLEEGRKED